MKPVKFKIYKPATPDHDIRDVNHAALPWVYDQDRASGFTATMWVTPVETLPEFIKAGKRARFPTMLRKMWSGSEVQEWLDANVNGGIEDDQK